MFSVPFYFVIPCIFLLGFLSLKVRFAISLITSLPQIYLINASGVDFPIALLFALSLWPEFIKNIYQIKNSKIIISLCLLIFISIVSLTWSSDLSMGLREIIYILVFIFIFCAAYSIAKDDSDFFYASIDVFIFLSALHAVLIIAFRLSPELESAFVFSEYSHIFMGSNLIGAIMNDGVRNNFFDPVKAGGFFVNANIAAAYSGAVAALSYILYKNKKKSRLFFVFLFIVAVFFTGSKAGVLFVLLLPCFIFYASSYSVKRNKLNLFMVAIFFILGLDFVFLFFHPELQSSDFLNESIDTSSIRILIWNFAIDNFKNYPLLGLGFGGWQKDFVSYAIQNGIAEFPPHNTLIYAWAKSGIFAMFASILFIWQVLTFSLSLIKTNNAELKNIGIGLSFLSCWLFLHGMGENFGLIGEQHQLVVFSALLGFGYGRKKIWKNIKFQNVYNNHSENKTGMVNL